MLYSVHTVHAVYYDYGSHLNNYELCDVEFFTGVIGNLIHEFDGMGIEVSSIGNWYGNQ